MPRELTCFVIAPANKQKDGKSVPVVVAKDDKWGLTELPSACRNHALAADTLEINFDDVYNTIITDAINIVHAKNPEVAISCIRGKDIPESGPILQQVIRRICEADVTITDITSNNPNVLLEYGLRLSVKDSGNILICHKLAQQHIPFDIQHLRAISYSTTDLSEASRATKEIAQFLISYVKTQSNAEAKTNFEQNIYYSSIAFYTGRLLEKNMTRVARRSPRLIAELAERVFAADGGREFKEEVFDYFKEYKEVLANGQNDQTELIEHLKLVSGIKGLGPSRIRETLYEIARICNADPLRKEEGARYKEEAKKLED